jgi:hypothetical protein
VNLLPGRDSRQRPAFLKKTAGKLLMAMVLVRLHTASGN